MPIRSLSFVLPVVVAALSGCGSDRPAVLSAPPVAVADSVPASAARAEDEPPAAASLSLADWLRARLPAGGDVRARPDGTVSVVHVVASGDTALSIARAYLDLTDVYRSKDLAADIARADATLAPGATIEIPHVLAAPYRSPEEERLRWPADRAMRAVFISGIYAGLFWPETVDKLAEHGLNAVVLDGKDYMGTVNYPTHVALALETDAAKNPPIPDLFRAIRFAHARGVRVIVRLPCFHDPWAAEHAPRVSLLGTSGRPFGMGWTDPANPEAQRYIVELAAEAVDAGADEIQLDYVRFPVYSNGIQYAAMPPADGHRSQVIKAFVESVHEVTWAHRVPLSLDLFGVTATGSPSDIEALGQNIGVIGGSAEVLSPMLYPSHYADGYMGFSNPGDHPEIVGMGTKGALEKLEAAHFTGTVVRPWLQAFAYKTPTYGPKYVEDEIRSAEASGAVGWLFWDPDNSYWPVWRALPVVPKP